MRFDAERDSFFTVLVFNDELRGPLPSSMGLIPQNSAALPAKLNASYQTTRRREHCRGANHMNSSFATRKPDSSFSTLKDINTTTMPAQHLLSIQMGRTADVERICRRTRASVRSRSDRRKNFHYRQPCARSKSRKLLTAKSRSDVLPATISPEMPEQFRDRTSSSETCRGWRNSATAAERRSASPSEPIPAISARWI